VIDLSVDINGVRLKNPVIAASGTYGFGAEYAAFYGPSRLGAICVKGLTLNPKQGNAGLRVFETAGGMMNSVGLQNPGVRHFLDIELPRLRELTDTVIIANVGGSRLDDYAEAARLIDAVPDDMIGIVELNISCPNVKEGGMSFGVKSGVAYEIVRQIRAVCGKTLMVKLSPNAEDIADMARACVEAGADALSLINTFKAMAVDIARRRPVFDSVFAGLSGPAIKPLALRMVYEVCKSVDVPVIGIGGITTAEDALEFIMAGAAAVQVGTANFMNPYAPVEIIEGIGRYLRENGASSVREITGIIQ